MVVTIRRMLGIPRRHASEPGARRPELEDVRLTEKIGKIHNYSHGVRRVNAELRLALGLALVDGESKRLMVLLARGIEHVNHRKSSGTTGPSRRVALDLPDCDFDPEAPGVLKMPTSRISELRTTPHIAHIRDLFSGRFIG